VLTVLVLESSIHAVEKMSVVLAGVIESMCTVLVLECSVTAVENSIEGSAGE
jgi:hypothetical protein